MRANTYVLKGVSYDFYKIQIEDQQKLIEELYEKLEEKKTSCEKFQIEIKEIKSNNSVLDDKIQALETEKNN